MVYSRMQLLEPSHASRADLGTIQPDDRRWRYARRTARQVPANVGNALVTLAVAELVAMSAVGTAVLPDDAAAVALGAGTLVAAAALDPLTPRAHPLAAVRRSIALAVGAALLLLLNTSWHVSGPRTVRLAVAVSVLALALSGAARTLRTLLGHPAPARLTTLSALALTGAAPLWLGPLIERAGAARPVVDAVVALSPLTYLAVMCDYDYLRGEWLYMASPIGSLRFAYPDAATMTAMYLALAALLLWINHTLERSRTHG